MKIEEYQEHVDQWIKHYGVRYFNEMTNALILAEEVGEFSRLIARSYGEQSFKEHITKEEIKERIQDEMADILFVVTCLANQMNINLTEALIENIGKKTKRDSTRHVTNTKINQK